MLIRDMYAGRIQGRTSHPPGLCFKYLGSMGNFARLEQRGILLLGPGALAQVLVLHVQEVVLDLLRVAPAQLRSHRLRRSLPASGIRA